MAAVARELDRWAPPATRPALRPVPEAAPGDERRSAPPARPPAAVYRRRRAVAALLALAAGLAVWAVVASAMPQRGAPVPPAAAAGSVTIVVGPGQTLWELALPHAPEGAHPTAYVAEVAAFNGIDARQLRPGMVVRLPPR